MTQQRRRANKLLIIVGLVTLVFGLWLLVSYYGAASQAAVVAGIAAVLSLLVTVLGYLRDSQRPPLQLQELADDLANTVRSQWLDEAKARRLRDPKVLPLTWTAADPALGDDPAAVVGPGSPGLPLRLRLDGRLDGSFDKVACQLAAGYGQIPSGRLVVLGEPGAGKTVLAILLTLGLLDNTSRTPAARVPVLLTAASWDPVTESMDAWVVQTLATSYYGGRPEIPRLLHDRGLLLPILDGLDELPESSRRSAVRAVNQSIGAEHPVVVTCRFAEYEDVIEGGIPALHRAPVVGVSPLSAEDVIVYLKAVAWPDVTDWKAVYDHLKEMPSSPIATALSTPLMVSVARRVYQRCGGDPTELLNTTKFGNRHAVEDELLSRIIDAAYSPDRLPSGEPIAGTGGKWEADQARRWLRFLARYLHQHRERDLAWWQLSERLISPWIAPLIGLGIGTVLMVLVTVWVYFLASAEEANSDRFLTSLAVGAGVGAAFALLAILAWFTGTGRSPGRPSLSRRGSLSRLRRGFVSGLVLTAFIAVPGLLFTALLISVSNDWSISDVQNYWSGLMIAGALAILFGLALAAHSWFDAPPARSAEASPLGFVQQDRRSSLYGSLAAGGILGVGASLALAAGMVAASLTTTGLAGGWSGGPMPVSLAVDQAVSGFKTDDDVYEMVGALFVLPAMIFTLLVLLSRAWPRFLVARLDLAVRGRLPLRLMGFLADAREQEVLRQSGGTYQFRHIRLQEWLANQPPDADRTPEAARRARRVRRGVLAMVTAVVLAGGASLISVLPHDSSRETILGASADVVFSRDDTWLARTSFDRDEHEFLTHVWELGKDGDRKVLHAGRVLTMAFSSDGSHLTTVSKSDGDSGVNSEYTLQLERWDVRTGQRVGTTTEIRGAQPVMGFTPHGDVLATLESRATEKIQTLRGRRWDTTTGEEIGKPVEFRTGPGIPVAFSPDLAYLMVGSIPLNGSLGLWNSATGHEIPIKYFTLHENFVFGSKSDGGLLLADRDGTIRVWDIIKGRQLRSGIPAGGSGAIRIGPGGRTLAVAGDEDARSWRCHNLDSGYESAPHTGHTRPISDMVFSHDGRSLATSSTDGTTRLWDVPEECR
ncbi:MAG: hypothetical protein ABIS86_06855 [Streptosporangiaceae bacterium]